MPPSPLLRFMTDTAIQVMRAKEALLEQYADIMLLALRKEAGVFLTTDEYYKAKEKLMGALKGMTTV
jgi:hypothetical protein